MAPLATATPGIVVAVVLSRLSVVSAIAFKVNGLEGDVAIANGLYDRSLETANGYPCYKNIDYSPGVSGQGIYLCMDAHGFWSIQPEQSKGTSAAWMHSSSRKTGFPHQAGPWLTHYGDNWTVDPDVIVTAEAGPEQPLVKRVVAMLIFGAAIAIAVVLVSVTGSDAHIRSQSYWLLSAALTGTIVLLIGKALKLSLYDTLVPTLFNQLGVNLAVVRLIISGTIFVAAFFSLNLFGWKLQERSTRLALVNGLAAHAVAVLSCTAFFFLLDQTLQHLAPQFSAITDDKVAQKATVGVLVVLLAFAVFLLFTVASRGRRNRKYNEKPVKPWAAPKPAAESSRAGCMGCGGGGGAPKVHGLDWQEVVADAEDEVASVTIGTLIVLVLNAVLEGSLLPAPVKVSGSVFGKWWTAVGVLACLNVLVFLVRAFVTPGGRNLSRLARSLAIATMFAAMEGAMWAIASNFQKSVTSQVAEAGLICAAAFLLFWLVDKVLDLLCGRRAGPSMRRLWGKLQQADDTMTPAERAAMVMSSALGLVVAVVLTRLLIDAIETLVGYWFPVDAGAGNRQVISSCLVAVSLIVTAAVLLIPYRSAILPMALLGEAEHQRAINRELEQSLRI
mmetsp:Transcript_131161/g.379407  ORF Transcript_131161/g.379407 Transcript_131161/m.379407 type:complete len:616 (+) Transcript_131161:95-1942(+)